MAADHWRYYCTRARTDRGAYRAANKSARQSAGSAARQFLLRQSAARGHERESCGNDNCKRLHPYFPLRGKYPGQFLTADESFARSRRP